jgi:phage-related minor tail protein
MGDEIETLLVGVRVDTAGFSRDVDTMRASLDGPLTTSVNRAGQTIETALAKALTSGSLGFQDFGKVALGVLDDIAAAAVKSGLGALFGTGSGGSDGGLLGALTALVAGAPGRATGGPVSPMRPYLVGEQGPELFVPTSSGSVVAAGGAGSARDVRVSITVQGGADAPKTLAASSRQVARAVKAALQ